MLSDVGSDLFAGHEPAILQSKLRLLRKRMMQMHGVSLLRELFVPDGKRPIWGIPVVTVGRQRVALKCPGAGFAGHNGTMGMRLERATWREVRWTGTGHWIKRIPVSYLALVAAVQSPEGWFPLYESWKDLTPTGLVGWFDQNRSKNPVIIQPDGEVVYQMSKEGRQLRWIPPSKRHDECGTVVAVMPGSWGKIKGSHYFLHNLLDQFGFPEEMLEPIPAEL